MSTNPLRDAYSAHLKATAPSDRQPCPSPETLQALAERRASSDVSGETDRRVLEHVLSCDHCRQDFALLRTAVGGALQAGLLEPATSTRAARTWWSGPRLLVAASAIVAVGLGGEAWRRSHAGNQPDRVVRDDSSDITIITPAATASTDEVRATSLRPFVWRTVPDANAYTIELLDTTGVVLVTRTTADTTMSLTDAELARVVAATAFDWVVIARRMDDNERRSALIRVRVQRER